MSEYRFDTNRLDAGYNSADHSYAVSTPIYATASYDLKSVQYARDLVALKEEGFVYTRIGNPTTDVLEKRVAELDGAVAAVAVGSGMAAISYTLLQLTENGGEILSTPYLYGGTRDAFKKVFPKFNSRIRIAENIEDTAKLESEINDETRAIYVESISNPNAYLLDIDAIAEIAHRHGIPLVVDNSVATPYLYNPIEHGADIVIYSLTKGLSGHGNLIGGLILESGRFDYNSDKFPQFREKYWTLRDDEGNYRSFLDLFPDAPFTIRIRENYLAYLGATLSPFDAYLSLVGIETLTERISKKSENALKLAKYLEQSPHAEWVRYPGLESSPYSKLADRDFSRGSGELISFGFRGTREQEDAFIDNLKIFHYHANLGDVRSLIVNSPELTHAELDPEDKKQADIPLNLIRISAGLEDIDDLIADLEGGFAAAFGK